MDVMTTNVITVGPDTSVQEVARILSERGISGVPVVSADNQLIGILSEGDLLHRVETGTERRPARTGRRRSWWLDTIGSDEELARGGAFVATFDADGQHYSADIVAMLRALTEHKAEVALGSRFLGNAVGMSMSRRILLRLAVLLTRLTTGLRVTDAHNGLRLFTRAAARKIRITQNRMAHASEILDQNARHKLAYVEVPVTITYTDHSRAKGQTLLGAADIIGELVLGKLARGN